MNWNEQTLEIEPSVIVLGILYAAVLVAMICWLV